MKNTIRIFTSQNKDFFFFFFWVTIKGRQDIIISSAINNANSGDVFVSDLARSLKEWPNEYPLFFMTPFWQLCLNFDALACRSGTEM